ncbi:MAG: YlxR family protein [Dehalococcoidia bacterium]|nr:YlxR family protein [Dehalococcoidia bacterium]
MLRKSRIPQRSCVACRTTKAKRDLVRLVCSAGTVEIDRKGKKTGRGAYLCPVRECWEAGLKGNRLEYTLRTKLTMENRQTLAQYGNSLPSGRENRP